MMIDLDNTAPESRYIPDVNGFNFVQINHGLGAVLSNPLIAQRQNIIRGPGYYRYGLPKLPSRGGWFGLKGLGIQYCSSNPPSAATQAQIAAAGGTVDIINCDYSTGGPGESGSVASGAAAPSQGPSGPQPAQNLPAEPTYQDCAALGPGTAAEAACTVANAQAQEAWETAYGVAQNNYNEAMCEWNGNPASYCQTIYPPGASSDEAISTPVALPSVVTSTPAPTPTTQSQASTQSGQPNQSVPPNPQPGTVPASTGLPATSTTIANQTTPASGGSGTQVTAPSCWSMFPASWGLSDTCIDSLPVGTLTLIGLAVGGLILWKVAK